MKLGLSVVASQGNTWDEVEELGTLVSLFQKGDSVSFSDKNLESDKLVTLFITEKSGGAPKMLPCSKRLSVSVRKALKGGMPRKSIIKALTGLNVIKNDKGYFLVPNGKVAESFTFDELKNEEEVSFEDLMAY